MSKSQTKRERVQIDAKILELSLKAVSKTLDELISACLEDAKPKQPSMQDIAKARGALPGYCVNAYKKKG